MKKLTAKEIDNHVERIVECVRTVTENAEFCKDTGIHGHAVAMAGIAYTGALVSEGIVSEEEGLIIAEKALLVFSEVMEDSGFQQELTTKTNTHKVQSPYKL